MLQRSKNCTKRGTIRFHTCAITGALLFLPTTVAPLVSQTIEAPTFENRFFFNDGAAPGPAQASEPPPASNNNAPAGTQDKADSDGVRPSRSILQNLITSPAEAAPTPAEAGPLPAAAAPTPAEAPPLPAAGRRAETAAVATRAKSVSRRIRPIGSGRAAWYEHPGRTASGEKFDPDRMTAAHKTLPFGTRLRVVNLQNGRTVVVRINDRIPAKTKTITIDLSRGSARAIGIQGVGRVALYQLDGSPGERGNVGMH
jgi:rare lipoprotein A